jgi:hypothetical protein
MPTAEMRRALMAYGSDRPFHILTVPCGLPRDVRDFTRSIAASQIRYTGLDLDPAVVLAAKEFMSGAGNRMRLRLRRRPRGRNVATE